MLDRLTFDTEKHRYLLDQQPVPSVSAILRATGFTKDYSAIPLSVMETARQRGIAVHHYCSMIDVGEVPDVSDALLPYVMAYTEFRRATRYQVIASERMIYHPTLLYAGQPDSIGWINGDTRTVLDIKVTAELDHLAVSVQTAAYGGAHNALFPDEPCTTLASLHLRRDGSFQFRQYDFTACWAMFKAAHDLYCHQRQFFRQQRKGR